MKNKSRAVFLDRDGTISFEVGYIDNVNDFKLIPGVTKALYELQELGFKLIVISNQSGVARGYFPESRVSEINNKMNGLMKEAGIEFDGIYYCPHLESGSVKDYAVNCSCRKPKPGMILKAENEHSIDLNSSFMIGDSIVDVQCGKNAGLKTIFVRTGHGTKNEAGLENFSLAERPDHIADDLSAAVEFIRKEMGE